MIIARANAHVPHPARAQAADDARAEGAWLETITAREPPAKALPTRAAEANHLTARGWARALSLARTSLTWKARSGSGACTWRQR